MSNSCDSMDCRLPGSSVHGISQARILGWVAISFSRGSSSPKAQTQLSCFAGRFFTIWAIRQAHLDQYYWVFYNLSFGNGCGRGWRLIKTKYRLALKALSNRCENKMRVGMKTEREVVNGLQNQPVRDQLFGVRYSLSSIMTLPKLSLLTKNIKREKLNS